ncbi:MAG: PilZ domain-containing protein [Acidobacteriota bacterium]
MDNRNEKRVYGLKKVIIKSEKKRYSAIITNVSYNGISVKSEYPFSSSDFIDMEIEIDRKPVSLQGSIIWVDEYPSHPESPLKEIGVALNDPPDDYLSYIKGISE